MSSTDRIARFEKRQNELGKMSDAELKNLFWSLCHNAVAPMVELSKTHTSPSIERSVLMRMGLDTFTAKAVVTKITEANLLGKGAGHCVLKVAEKKKTSLENAAKEIAANPDILKNLF